MKDPLLTPTWIFDLDDTLHHATPGIFPHINKAMTDYVVHHLHLSQSEASALRQRYWQTYGATLLGLTRHHQVDPHHFLRQTHLLHEILPLVKKIAGLRHVLKRLPGRKLVFTNAPLAYAEAILDTLGIRNFFYELVSIECVRFQPKPSLQGFGHLIKITKLDPKRCIMVEDSADNLRTAKRLGMHTVLVGTGHQRPAFVDLKIKSVTALPRHIRRFIHL